MKDKLSKKRIKVDYEKMIVYLYLDGDFVHYMWSRNSKISMRRLALAFLRTKKVDVEATYFEMKQKGLLVDNDRDPITAFKFDDSPESGDVFDNSAAIFTDNSRFY